MSTTSSSNGNEQAHEGKGDDEIQRMQMTLKADVYGQIHPIETPEGVQASLEEFEEELNLIPPNDKLEVLQAQAKCPQLITPEFWLKFLRCEVFHANKAAKRYVLYWKKRVEIFGRTKAFLPLTLEQALADDEAMNALGIMTLLPNQFDPKGRALIYFDPANLQFLSSSKSNNGIVNGNGSNDETDTATTSSNSSSNNNEDGGSSSSSSNCENGDTTSSLVRCFWYVLHAALLSNEDTVKHGILVLVDPQRSHYSQFMNTAMVSQLFVKAMSGALPLRLSGIHIFYPPFYCSLILPLVRYCLPTRLQQRILFHTDTPPKVMEVLDTKYGIPSDSVPVELGGTLIVNHQAWLQDRKEQGL